MGLTPMQQFEPTSTAPEHDLRRCFVAEAAAFCYQLPMTIALTPVQTVWLEQAVAEGRFASVEAALQVAVSNLMTEASDATADDDWLLPLLDDARTSAAGGESLSLDEFKAHVARRHIKAD